MSKEEMDACTALMCVRSLLRRSSSTERKTVLNAVKAMRANKIDAKGFVMFYGGDVEQAKMCKMQKLAMQVVEMKRMKARKPVSFPCATACVVCLNFNASATAKRVTLQSAMGARMSCGAVPDARSDLRGNSILYRCVCVCVKKTTTEFVLPKAAGREA